MKSLRFNQDSGRWEIVGRPGLAPRELHCGDTFKLYPNPPAPALPPIPVQIEHSDGLGGWYLLTPYGITRPSERMVE